MCLLLLIHITLKYKGLLLISAGKKNNNCVFRVFLSWLSPPARIKVLFLYCKDAITMRAVIITAQIIRAVSPWILFRFMVYRQSPSTIWTPLLAIHNLLLHFFYFFFGYCVLRVFLTW